MSRKLRDIPFIRTADANYSCNCAFVIGAAASFTAMIGFMLLIVGL